MFDMLSGICQGMSWQHLHQPQGWKGVIPLSLSQTVSPFRVQYVPASVQLCIRDFCRSEGGGEDVLPIFQPLSAE